MTQLAAECEARNVKGRVGNCVLAVCTPGRAPGVCSHSMSCNHGMPDQQRPGLAAMLLQVVDLDALRELAWSGVPSDLRPTCWQLLLGYLPPNRERR